MKKSKTYITFAQKEFLTRLCDEAERNSSSLHGEVAFNPANMPDHRLISEGKRKGLWAYRFVRNADKKVSMYYLRPLVKIVPFDLF